MHALSLAFVWHQHQPYYPDDLGGEIPMPWVRLHGAKDYWGMAALLDEFPKLHATINLVPSLLVQLAAYGDPGRQDEHLRVSRLPADGFSERDTTFLLDNFFMVHPDHMIHPYPRYNELFEKRGFAVDSAERARKRFTKRDIVDLQCWSNLVWFHPLALERDKELAEFRKKGRHWTEAEKQWLLGKQLDLLRDVVPLHRRLLERGQVELTTSPFYHPILPLLWDKRLARRAMPGVALPQFLDGYLDDAREQIRRAVEFHEKVFGQKPRGMWPSEGSVCQGMIPAIADAGVQWIATDEEILCHSTENWSWRDANGYLRNPELLYRPWRVDEAGRHLQVLFRDHAMSDQIGFHYQRDTPGHAVDDFVGKLEAIRNATTGKAGHRPPLVSIILDGENCWEYYPNSGLEFLRGLYRRIAEHPKIAPVRVGDYLDRHPATERLGHLFAGSWIQHNFGIWIGQADCNRAWDLLHQTRQHLVRRAKEGGKSAEQLRRAWEEMYIAEGSDWFWWFDESHSCAQSSLFDRLFRKHLQNVYLCLQDEPPSELARPISQGGRQRLHSVPTGLLHVKVDGRRTYFEWINAGRYVCQGSRGAMNTARAGLVSDLYFGFDTERLFIRLDAARGPLRERLAEIARLRITLFRPEGFQVVVSNPAQRVPRVELLDRAVVVANAGIEAAADWIFEMSIPFRTLGVATDDPIQFAVELLEGDQSVERIPSEGAIETTVPSPDYELIMWQA
jgi:alpha-amylase/alpha-mannosidase (GH57 family)